jgi:hypothetical protein
MAAENLIGPGRRRVKVIRCTGREQVQASCPRCDSFIDHNPKPIPVDYRVGTNLLIYAPTGMPVRTTGSLRRYSRIHGGVARLVDPSAAGVLAQCDTKESPAAEQRRGCARPSASTLPRVAALSIPAAISSRLGDQRTRAAGVPGQFSRRDSRAKWRRGASREEVALRRWM